VAVNGPISRPFATIETNGLFEERRAEWGGGEYSSRVRSPRKNRYYETRHDRGRSNPPKKGEQQNGLAIASMFLTDTTTRVVRQYADDASS